MQQGKGRGFSLAGVGYKVACEAEGVKICQKMSLNNLWMAL